MADYTVITDSQVDPDAPLTSNLAYAWRDNPIAIAEGAVGAPRIVDAALSTAATNVGRNWVLNRQALTAAGSVGSLALLVIAGPRSPVTSIGFGDLTNSADSLNPANSNGTGSAPIVGTWRCLGYVPDTRSTAPEQERVSLFIRVS